MSISTRGEEAPALTVAFIYGIHELLLAVLSVSKNDSVKFTLVVATGEQIHFLHGYNSYLKYVYPY